MALRKIVTEGDPILRKRAREVEEVSDRIRGIFDDMVETMRDADGCGLAAPQVGLLKRLIVVEVPEPTLTDETANTEEDLEIQEREEGEETPMIPLTLANPEIMEAQGTQTGAEGCLSVPGYTGTVERPRWIKLRALDYSNNQVEIEAEGFLAVAISHEMDHLEGVLFTDKATEVKDIYSEEAEGEEE